MDNPYKVAKYMYKYDKALTQAVSNRVDPNNFPGEVADDLRRKYRQMNVPVPPSSFTSNNQRSAFSSNQGYVPFRK